MKTIIVLPKSDEDLCKYIRSHNNIEVVQEYIYFNENTLYDIINCNPDLIIISKFVHGENIDLRQFIFGIKTNTNARVILLTGGLGVGDKFLHEMVTIGVWDILDETEFKLERITEMINTPAQFRDVAKYRDPNWESASVDIKNIFKKINGPAVKPKVVVKEVVKEVVVPKEIIKEKEVIKEVVKEVAVVRQVAQPGLKETVVFWSPKETGKTFLASNYAIALAQQPHSPNVLLIDGDLEGRDQFVQFKVSKNCFGLAEAINCTTIKDLKKTMYQPKGLPNLHVMAVHPKQIIDKIDGNTLQHLQDYLRQDIDYIVVDAGRNHNDPFTKGALRVASKVYIVANLEWTKFFYITEAVTALKNSRINLSKYRIIVNQHVSNKDITPKEITKYLDIPLGGVIPFDFKNYSAIISGLFEGTPILLQDRDDTANIRQAIESLIFTDVYQPPDPSPGKTGLSNLVAKTRINLF